jgi:hypothetical protein
MKLIAATGAALAIALVSAQAQEAPVTVSAIHVVADVTTIASPSAADYWRDLPADLEDALAREFVGSLDSEGQALLVAVDTLSLKEAYDLGFGDDARLVGRVQLVEPGSEEVTATWDIAASARQAESFFPADVDVVTIDRTSREFYDAVVGAFARGVVETVRGGS